MMLFIFACLNTFRHIYYIIQNAILSTEENPRRYILTKRELLFLGLSVAFVLSSIFTGIQI